MFLAEFYSDDYWASAVQVSSYEEAKARASSRFRVLHVIDMEVVGIMEEDFHGVFYSSIDGIDYL